MADELILWHNPRCSKSRTALKLLEEAGAPVRARQYLKEVPDEAEIRRVLGLLARPAIDLVRRGEAVFRELGLSEDSDEAVLVAAMAAHPILIERPVAIAGDRAVIGRPPEEVLGLV